MTSTAPEPTETPVSQNHLRDRLLAVAKKYDAVDPEVLVEDICDQMSGWLRLMAADWNERAALEVDITGTAQAAATLCLGLADGIEAGRP